MYAYFGAGVGQLFTDGDKFGSEASTISDTIEAA